MADYKVPGVYVEEPFGLSLSIHAGETAVPAFAFDAENTTWGGAIGDVSKTAVIDKSGVKAFESWLEVTSIRQSYWDKVHNSTESNKDAAAAQAVRDFDTAIAKDPLYQSLKLYFINGGGHGYLVPVERLETLVPVLDDVTLLVQAGVNRTKFNNQVKNLCIVGKTYFAIYDGPTTELTTTNVSEEAANYSAGGQFAAVYYPWLIATVPKADDPTKTESVDVPPSSVMAGVYARVDRERGVWKAPANIAIIGAEPKFKVSDAVDGKCNVPDTGGRSINVIRSFRGTGPLVWGARTLQSDQDTWRYVPVRRLFNAAERDIRAAMSPALFEPNHGPTWERVRSAVENYVHSLWQQGALLGDTPEQAYFVHIGRGLTMNDDDIKKGRMILKVGLSAVRPAEFIILKLTQDIVPA